MKRKLPFLFLLFSFSVCSQIGLPIWPISPVLGDDFQTLDWTETPPIEQTISPTNFEIGSVSSAFDKCGNLIFYALHTGQNQPENLFFYTSTGAPLLTTSSPNGPGLNGLKGAQETQLIPVPETTNQWYIIYSEWSNDNNAVNNNAIYNPSRILFSRLQWNGTNLTVLDRDILLTANGSAQTYNDGRAISPDVAGNNNSQYLYAARRSLNNSNLSVDRFLIQNSGISFLDNTGNINVGYWELTHAASPIELSQDGSKIAVISRNQSDSEPDLLIFDANNFNANAAEVIFVQDLFLNADGQVDDQSSELNAGAALSQVAADANLNLAYLQNVQHKISGCEWSPNGNYLYLKGGGFAQEGTTHLTYLMQVDFTGTSPSLRLQIQEPPFGNYSATTGAGCTFSSSGCLENYQSIGYIQSAFDGNIYFSKRSSPTLFVIPNPDEPMPQNLIPSDIDLSNSTETNITLQSGVRILPEQIDGYDYIRSNLNMPFVNVIDTFACAGTNINILGQEIMAGETLIIDGILEACDTIYEIQVQEVSPQDTEEFVSLCNGEEVVIFGELISTAGTYSMSFLNTFGCDSTHTVFVDLNPEIVADFMISPTCPDVNSGSITVDISNGTEPFSIMWNTGSNSNIISDLSEGSYSITISDANNCERTEILEISTINFDEYELTAAEVSCLEEDDGQININTSGIGLEYSLDGFNFQEENTFTNLASGQYIVWLRNQAGCIVQEEIMVNQAETVTVILPQDTLLNLGDSLILIPQILNADNVEYSWSPSENLSCTACPNPVVSPFAATIIQLEVRDSLGCSATDDIFISVKNIREIFFPDAFSPNNDGINDVIFPYFTAGVEQIESMHIYSRWGELLHEVRQVSSNQNALAWDGKLQGKDMPIGVYIYVIEVTFIDGVSETFRGSFTLLR